MYGLRNSVFLLAILALATPVCAEPIVNARPGPVTIQVGDVPQLQSIFTSLFGSAGALSAMNNQTNYGSFQPTALTNFTFLGSVAGYERSNVLSVYEVNNPSISRVVFDRVDITNSPNHQVGDKVSGAFSPSAQQHQFGLFLDVFAADGDTSDLDYTVFTDDLRNPGQLPQALVFFGSGQRFAGNIGIDNIFGADDIIVAFEDLNRRYGRSDDDFNDLIVLIENVKWGQNAPDPDFEIRLPEPASIAVWSLLASCGGIFSWRRWRQSTARGR